LHTLVGDEEPAGFEAFHVADGRRAANDGWTATTSNAQHTLTVTCDRLRGATACILDRGHNLAGVSVFLETSMDNASWQTVVSPTIPTASLTAPFSNVNGVTTEEAAWGIVFPAVGGLYWRLRIPALGVGILPVVVGLWVGMAYQPPSGFLIPWSEDQDTLVGQETVSEWGWRGRGPVVAMNSGALNMKLLTDDEYDVAPHPIAGHYGWGRPLWICYDQDQADRTFLGIRPFGEFGYGYRNNWWPRQGSVPYIEHEPIRPT